MEPPVAQTDKSIEVSLSALDARVSENQRYEAQLRLADKNFNEERDRRYTEVAQEREKALKIKEQADRDALELARQIQTYKDEKANELREQINMERGQYASKNDLIAAVEKLEETLKPVNEFISNQRGRQAGIGGAWTLTHTILTVGLALAGLYLANQRSSSVPQAVYQSPVVLPTQQPTR